MALTILVVDDSDPLRTRLVDTLRAIDGVARVDETSSVAATRRYLAGGWADVFVLDIALEDGSGLELLRELRRRSQAAVVIMLTNHSSLLYRHNCLAAGADFFLDKSTEFEALIDLVRALAGKGTQS